MTSKMKTITLSWPWFSGSNVKNYKVEKITDSTEYHPGDILSERQVNELCHSPKWKITIVKS